MMGPEQKALFRETQAVMSLLEGFSDYVMDEVGRDLVPGRRADQRPVPRATRPSGPPFERSMLRLTGMDLKMEQYKKGEQFVRAIAERARPGGPGAPVGGSRDAAARRRDRRARPLDRPRPRRVARVTEPVVTAGRGPGSGPRAGRRRRSP